MQIRLCTNTGALAETNKNQKHTKTNRYIDVLAHAPGIALSLHTAAQGPQGPLKVWAKRTYKRLGLEYTPFNLTGIVALG